MNFIRKIYIWIDVRLCSLNISESDLCVPNVGRFQIEGYYNVAVSVVDVILKNFKKINDLWNKSDRQNRIKIVYYWNNQKKFDSDLLNSTNFIRVSIIKDNSIYSNKYWKKFKNDFYDWNKNETYNLGIIKYNNCNNFINTFLQKYNNSIINDIEFIRVPNYEYNSLYSKIKIKLKTITQFYPFLDNWEIKMKYILESKLNEISNQLFSDRIIDKLLYDLSIYKQLLPIKNNNYKNKENWKKTYFKYTEKEIIKSYLNNWNYIFNLVEEKLQLNELNKSIPGIHPSFEDLKNKINNLIPKIENLENISEWNCDETLVSSNNLDKIPITNSIASAVAIIGNSACNISKI